jgi:hypothetical protein
MNKQQLREHDPVMAAIVDELRPSITGMAYYIDGKLVAGAPPADPPGAAWVTADSYIRMREYAGDTLPALPKMAKKK